MSFKTKPARSCEISGSFSRYVLTKHSTEKGITSVPFSRMTRIIGPNADDTEVVVDLGFTFWFNGIAYNNMTVSVNGWIVLDSSKLTTDFIATPYLALSIRQDITPTEGALLAPWASDLYTVYSEIPTWGPLGGVWYVKDHGPDGVRGIIRWVDLNYYTGLPGNPARMMIVFECVLYEKNGTIEYRYSPIYNNAGLSNSPAAEPLDGAGCCGIWTSGSQNWRDFTRMSSSYGGATYDPAYSYTETSTLPWNFDRRTVSLSSGGKIYAKNWPAGTMGSVYTFSPPVSAVRNSPRRELPVRDASNPVFDTNRNYFHDQTTLVYTASGSMGSDEEINFPTTLSVRYGDGTLSPKSFQTIKTSLTTDDPSVSYGTGVTKVGTEYWIHPGRMRDEDHDTTNPFDDSSCIEQDVNIKSSSFYLTGTAIDEYYEGFEQNIGSKTIIRLSFPILSSTALLGSTASMYYYDPYRMVVREMIPRDELKDPGDRYSPGAMVDSVGFTPLGTVASNVYNKDYNHVFGTVDSFYPDAKYRTATEGFGLPTHDYTYNTSFISRAIQASNHGLPTVSSSMCVAQSGTITMDMLEAPFVIEKAIFRFPIEVGSGWSSDMTRTKRTFIFRDYDCASTSGSLIHAYWDWPLDVGGPCVTVGLMNQLLPNLRDIVVTGTFIPTADNVDTIAFEKCHLTSAYDYDSSVKKNIYHYSITQQGYLSFGKTPSAVVIPDASGQYTGSITVPTVSCTSVGLELHNQFYVPGRTWSTFAQDANGDYTNIPQYTALTPPSPPYSTDSHDKFLYILVDSYVNPLTYPNVWLGRHRNETIDCTKDTCWAGGFMMININPYGRNKQGFSTTGRSIRDTNSLDLTHVHNPLYKHLDTIHTWMSQTHDALGTIALTPVVGPAGDQYARFVALPDVIYSAETQRKAPYLVMPGDELIFFLSKHRPVKSASFNELISASAITTPIYPGEYLAGNTGSIVSYLYAKLTGSHDIKVGTGSLEIVLYGSYVRENREIESVSFTTPVYSDVVCDVIGNTPITDQYDVDMSPVYSGTWTDCLITGSLFYATIDTAGNRTYTDGDRGLITHLTDTSDDLASGDDLVTRKTFLREWRGSFRFSQAHDNKERYWDTLLPSLSDIWKTDNVNVYDDYIWSKQGSTMTTAPAAIFYMGEMPLFCTGTLVPTNPIVHAEMSSSYGFSSRRWERAFPWETRYADLPRYSRPFKSISTTKRITDYDTSTFSQEKCVKNREQAAIAMSFGSYSIGGRGWFIWMTGMNLKDYTWDNTWKCYSTANVFADEAEFIKVAFGYTSRPPFASTDVKTVPYKGVPQDSSLLSYYPGTRYPKLRFRCGTYRLTSSAETSYGMVGCQPEGWKYGIMNGFRQVSKAIYRRNAYGQYRDMLEQRLDGKFFYETIDDRQGTALSGASYSVHVKEIDSLQFAGSTVSASPVLIEFIGPDGMRTDPDKTESGNLSFEATSSVPYFDGEVRNRFSEWTYALGIGSSGSLSLGSAISVARSVSSMNKTLVSVGTDTLGNIKIV